MTKKPCAVYLIDRNSVEKKETSEEIVARIVWEVNKGISEKAKKTSKPIHKFKPQKVKSEWLKHGYKIELYYKSNPSIPDWRGFISGIAEKGSQIYKAQNKNTSYMCFIYNSENIFSVAAGSGSFAISKYADQMFGLEILMKLIDRDSKVIKSLRSRGITGNTLAAFQIFKKDQIILSQETYGQLYKEIAADLDFALINTKLGIDIGNRQEANCLAKNSFKIGRSISFEELLDFIDHLVELKDEDGNDFNVNRLELVNKRTQSGKKLIEQLNSTLKKNLYKYLKKKTDSFSFEVCHTDYEKYFFADKYEIYHETKDDKSLSLDNRITYFDLKNYFKDKFRKEFSTQRDFVKLIEKIKIVTYDEEGHISTDSQLTKHLNGEVTFKGETYFYIDNEWIKMKSDLIDDLDEDVSAILSEIKNEGYLNTVNLPKWDKTVHKIEDNYNASFIGSQNVLVFHKVLYKNIEMADIIKWDDSKIKMIHVKSGFDSSMRDLTSQINNSARLLVNEQKSNKYKFAEVLYDRIDEIYKLKKKRDYKPYFNDISEQVKVVKKSDFVDLFRTRDVEFCLAVLDESKTKDIMKISEYNSNIAKLATLDLVRKMNALNVPLYIEEI